MYSDIGVEIINLRQQGLSLKAIERQLRCSRATVSKWCATLANNEEIIINLKKAMYADRFQNSKITKKQKERELTLLNQQIRSTSKIPRYNAARRIALKAFLIKYAGNRCQICGYNRSNAALAFHHLDPSTKLFAISSVRLHFRPQRLIAEAEKCCLVCHNCHSEIHDGLIDPKTLKPACYDGVVIPKNMVKWYENELRQCGECPREY